MTHRREEKHVGYSYANEIEQAAKHLLELLKAEGSVRYSRFYDGQDETREALLRGMGYGPALDGTAEEDYVPECPEHLMDLAVAQLEQQHVLRTTDLEDLLFDENNDYLIELTDEGRSRLERGDKLRFWDAE
jgi:hypothetical protein